MKGLKAYLIKGIIFVSVVGTIFHFIYQWSGDNFFVGLFTPTNESIWEHTKLLFFPMLMYSFFPNKKVKENFPFIDSALILGAISGVLAIIVLYYTYSGIIGFNIAVLDILIFYLSVILSFYISYIVSNISLGKKYERLLVALQIIMIFLFVLLTVMPPHIPLFANPN